MENHIFHRKLLVVQPFAELQDVLNFLPLILWFLWDEAKKDRRDTHLPLHIPNAAMDGVRCFLFWEPVVGPHPASTWRDPLAGHLLPTLVRTFLSLVVLSQDQSLAQSLRVLQSPACARLPLPASGLLSRAVFGP